MIRLGLEQRQQQCQREERNTDVRYWPQADLENAWFEVSTTLPKWKVKRKNFRIDGLLFVAFEVTRYLRCPRSYPVAPRPRMTHGIGGAIYFHCPHPDVLMR